MVRRVGTEEDICGVGPKRVRECIHWRKFAVVILLSEDQLEC